MLTRDSYTKKQVGCISTQNEPGNDVVFNVNARSYPDMFKIYNIFCQRYGLQLNEFILANGAENALKNCLLAIKPTALQYAIPTWGMVDVICNALDIQTYTAQFYVKDHYVHEPQFESNIINCPLYTTYKYSNLFKITNADFYSISNNRVVILDVSYCNEDELKQLLTIPRQNKNIIVIGSFDKLAGCGLRFGFCIFNSKYNNDMQLQREQFLNSIVEDFVVNRDFHYEKNDQYYNILSKMICDYDTLTYNYMTLCGNVDANCQTKKIHIDNITFTRFGFPHDKYELNTICNALFNRHI